MATAGPLKPRSHSVQDWVPPCACRCHSVANLLTLWPPAVLLVCCTHCCAGGLFGLVGAVLCGPRLGRFDGGLIKEIPGHDMAFVTLGTFMLWFGWYGFNAGSVYSYANPNGATVQRVAMNTTLGAAAGGLAALLVASWWQRTYDLRISCNGVLSGLVVVTSMCGFVDPWAAVVGGTIAGAVYTVVSHLLVGGVQAGAASVQGKAVVDG